jgi:alkanesulfonate monooxygenase SsuD/methylene tetrahydromethanopterin reductase-like flavin-dependent oxidoreductase (luciferase family)
MAQLSRNHAPLVVAEQFGTLEALHPGRVDLGIGRTSGTDQVTALALSRTMEGLSAEEFPQELDDLIGYFTGREPRMRITAICADADEREVPGPPGHAVLAAHAYRPGTTAGQPRGSGSVPVHAAGAGAGAAAV